VEVFPVFMNLMIDLRIGSALNSQTRHPIILQGVIASKIIISKDHPKHYMDDGMELQS
jgi:hypothetical protein